MTLLRVVAITGCDSGLGWAIAARSAREGLVTVAGMYTGTDTPAAHALVKLKAQPYQLDVNNPDSIASFGDFVRKLLQDNPNYRLYAIVNNAGIMTVGDYEWQTPNMIENTINVNLLGPMRIISNFLPDLRRTALEGKIKPRVINVASHCGVQPLPSFGPYCATKAGLIMLTKALRMELLPYGVYSVNLIPGGFFNQSNILSKQTMDCKIMLENLNDEQKSVYRKRVSALMKYLDLGSHRPAYDAVKNEDIIESFAKALNADAPQELYKVEPWRYKFYYLLMKLPLPERTRYWLVNKFLNFPTE